MVVFCALAKKLSAVKIITYKQVLASICTKNCGQEKAKKIVLAKYKKQYLN